VGPTAGLNKVAHRKRPAPARNRIPDVESVDSYPAILSLSLSLSLTHFYETIEMEEVQRSLMSKTMLRLKTIFSSL